MPFGVVEVVEVDDGAQQVLTVTVTLSPDHGDIGNRGRLTNLGAFVYAGDGAYSASGVTAAQATAALRGLVFEPLENRIIAEGTEATTLTISVDDGFVADPVTDGSTVVAAQAVNDPPTIAGTVARQTVDWETIRPFAGVTVAERDDGALQSLEVTVTQGDPMFGEFLPTHGFRREPGGVYTFEGTAEEATAALRAMTFDPGQHGHGHDHLPKGVEMTMTIAVDDGFAAPVVDATTSVVDCHGLSLRDRDEFGCPPEGKGKDK